MTDRRKTKAQLIEEVESLRARVQASSACDTELQDRFASTGFWVVDTDFAVRMANQTMLELLGGEPSNVIGAKCYELLGGPRCHTQDCSLRRVFADDGVGTYSEARTSSVRIPLRCHVVARMLRDPRSNAVGVIEEISAPRPGAQASASESAAAPPTERVDPPPADSLSFAEQVSGIARSLEGSVQHDPSAQRLVQDLLAACGSFLGTSRRAPSGEAHHQDECAVLVVTPPRGVWTQAMESLLHEGGYRVVRAHSPAGADEALSRNPPFDAAIIDLALRNPESAQVYARLREVQPLMPVFALSSDGGDALERRRWRRPRTWYVRQPIDVATLYDLLSDVAPLPRAARPDAL